MIRVGGHHLDLIGQTVAVEKLLRLGQGQIGASAVDVIAPGGKDIDHLIGRHPRAGAHRGAHAIGGNQPDLVAQSQPQFPRHPRADGDAIGKLCNVTQSLFRLGDAWNVQKITGFDPKNLDPDVRIVKVGHHLPAHQSGHTGHAGHRQQAGGQGGIIGNGAAGGPGITDRDTVIDRHMRVGAQDGIDKLCPKPRPHRQRGDQGEHRQRDADQRNPGHYADPAGRPFGPQVTPGNHPFKTGKGSGLGHLVLWHR